MICPSCGTMCDDNAAYCLVCGNPFENATADTETDAGSQNTDTGTKKKSRPGIWKLACVVFLAAAVVLAVLYAQQTERLNSLQLSYDNLYADYQTLDADRQSVSSDRESLSHDYSDLQGAYTALEESCHALEQQLSDLQVEHDTLTGDYNNLHTEYEQLQALYSPYEGRYTVTLTDTYNGDKDYNRISDTLEAANLDCLCATYDFTDSTGKWADAIYIDVIAPDGSVLMPDEESNNHTWYIDPSGTDGTVHSRKCWWQTDWVPGTYRLVFYQNDTAFATLYFPVS